MAKSTTGNIATAYIGTATILSFSLSINVCPAQNDSSIAAMPENRQLIPISSFLGRSCLKSRSSNREVMMARKKTRAVMDRQSAISEAMQKTSKALWSIIIGKPWFWSSPPGTVAEVANATVAMRAATTEQDSEVFTSQSFPVLTKFSCVCVKIWAGVSPFVLG